MMKVSRKGRLCFSALRRLRSRAAAQEETEIHQKRTAEDKKLQAAITREGKARETAEKKARKKIERADAREEIVQEKVTRAAEKEIKKA